MVNKASSRGFVLCLAGRNDTETLRDTIEELIELEEVGEGADNAGELSLLRNVLSVRDVAVEDVMVPRADIRAVEVTTTIADVAKIMSESGHSRLPVFREQLDDVIGMVHIKDFWPVGMMTREQVSRRSCASRYSLHRLCQYLNCSSKCGCSGYTWRWSRRIRGHRWVSCHYRRSR